MPSGPGAGSRPASPGGIERGGEILADGVRVAGSHLGCYLLDLRIVIDDLLPLAVSPCLILAVVGGEQLLPLLLRAPGCVPVLLELRQSALACFLMLPASCGAESAQSAGRDHLIGALVGHHHRNGQRPGREWRYGHLPHQLLRPKRRLSQDSLKKPGETGDLFINLAGPGRGVHLTAVLVGAQRLPLVPRTSANRFACGALLFQLSRPPGPLLRLALPLLAALRFCPRSQHSAALPSRHRPSLP